MRILVVDDDEILVEILRRSLSNQRHIVDIAEDGQLGWEYVQTGEYDLVLLDVNLPNIDGVSLCEKIRLEGYTTPILLMTAKNASQDRIVGLDAGADDYLIKPLDLDELNARVRALSRRGEVLQTTILDVNGLTLNPSSCEVSYQQQLIKLTAKEYSLLELFLRNPARVYSRSQILDKIWTFDDPPLEESVKAHIKGLRRKLKKAGVIDWIENVYGIGYRLNPQVVESPKTEENPNQSVSSSIEQEFNQNMEKMWLKYQDKMIERMKILKDAAATVKEAELSPDLHHNAKKAAHKLAGVLGMFSRDTGTEIACEIETLLQNNQVLDSPQKEQFISLVADLDSLLALDETLTNNDVTETPKLLLISTDTQLSQELQQLGKSQGIGWHSVKNTALAKTWLQNNSPYTVVIDTETIAQQSEYLSLITQLNARTPAIPVLVISATDSLEDRVAVARAGANSFLVKPVTPTIVWQTNNQLLEHNQSEVSSILIVDDDLVFLAALRSLLEPWGIRVTTLEEPLRFWEVLQTTRPDLVILDVEMPQINGIELCQALRNDPDWQELPILFLTARRDAQTIQQIFEIGGDDYISKPVVGVELIARINNRLERSRLLHNLATKNHLTGLKNRIQSSREIETLLQQAKENQQPFCLAVLKITQLQHINLQYGHGTGDRVLVKWGKVIQAALRHNEVTGYWGNGDFIIGIPYLDKTQTQERLKQVLIILRKQIFTSIKGERFQAVFNCGIAEFSKDGDTLHSLYQACV
ncbi:Multi-component transcriptional regulator [Hyella patelloides LEGE 07179]|uniref:Multi-component transcriptional regulator n=1 Tax=Hyella patelloides LEGE 07179 TaxID=945734 RepID=A0A563VVA4_9CYAN|nr:response regulator [Hyella patelloides]VEP15340.1 Multi-component transcriptional regulator [Hyella patelloides LEGE 07179]